MKDFLKYTLASIIGVCIAGLFLFFIMIGIISAMVSSGDPVVQVENNSILHLTLNEQIVERTENNIFDEMDIPGLEGSKKIGLDDILRCIKNAKDDSRIKGIYLDPSEITAGVATVEEIRQALIDFKTSGKFIYAYGEAFSQKAYYLVSVADTIVLNPQGMLDFRGLGGERNFFKNGLEKLGVEVQIVRHGKFKAAVEPYIREDMSPENKEQTLTYMKSIWNEMLTDISAKRNISVNDLNDIANMVATFRKAEYARDKKLVDKLKYYDEVLDDLRDLSGLGKTTDLRTIKVDKYRKAGITHTDGKGLARDKVAIVYASGDIDGMGDDGIKSDELSQAIREARTDSTVKAIVLRINSPGGSAYGSEVIWREVKLAAATKPVIASMGDVAASGGYYIACAADTIMADRTTITGSIGIFGMIPNVHELLTNKLGITQDVAMTNEHSDMISLTRKMTPFENDLMQARIEDGYDTFISRVAEGRKMTKEKVDEIGQGRVWASSSARMNGLVDIYGGVNEAVELARKQAKLEHFRIVAYPKLKDPVEELIKDLTGTAKMKLIKSELGEENYKYYDQMKNVLNSRGILARMPYDISIN